MGRRGCCSKEELNRGAWTAHEDKILSEFIQIHGEGRWRNLPKKAGLKRCGKSCRLRWLNYLRPGIKRGNISPDEEELIIRLHKLLGNSLGGNIGMIWKKPDISSFVIIYGWKEKSVKLIWCTFVMLMHI